MIDGVIVRSFSGEERTSSWNFPVYEYHGVGFEQCNFIINPLSSLPQLFSCAWGFLPSVASMKVCEFSYELRLDNNSARRGYSDNVGE
jgi:hypothetical protein